MQFNYKRISNLNENNEENSLDLFGFEMKKGSKRAFFQLVPGAGLEPARPYGQWILSP